MRRRQCENTVANDFCLASADDVSGRSAAHTCQACGQAVCENCSLLRSSYHERKERLCHDCTIAQQGDEAVMAHLGELASLVS